MLLSLWARCACLFFSVFVIINDEEYHRVAKFSLEVYSEKKYMGDLDEMELSLFLLYGAKSN